jgi:hypothetical protein
MVWSSCSSSFEGEGEDEGAANSVFDATFYSAFQCEQHVKALIREMGETVVRCRS